MQDGNTATHVSPVKEEDMAKVREVFQKALDAILAATELSKIVQSMRVEVDQLRADLTDYQARNVELDRMLSDTRRQRDDAEHGLAQAKTELRQTADDLAKAQTAQAKAESHANELLTSLNNARKDRDDHAIEAMSLQEVLDKANEKLSQLHKAMGVEFKPFAVPKPEPKPAEPEQPAVPAPAKVYQSDPGFDWSKPYAWDHVRQENYQ